MIGLKPVKEGMPFATPRQMQFTGALLDLLFCRANFDLDHDHLGMFVV